MPESGRPVTGLHRRRPGLGNLRNVECVHGSDWGRRSFLGRRHTMRSRSGRHRLRRRRMPDGGLLTRGCGFIANRLGCRLRLNCLTVGNLRWMPMQRAITEQQDQRNRNGHQRPESRTAALPPCRPAFLVLAPIHHTTLTLTLCTQKAPGRAGTHYHSVADQTKVFMESPFRGLSTDHQILSRLEGGRELYCPAQRCTRKDVAQARIDFRQARPFVTGPQ